MTATERLDKYAAFARAYAAKAAPEITDIDWDAPADAEPVYTCSGCGYPVLATFATLEAVAGRKDRWFCPRCVKGGALKGAA